jgi:crossover junction endodeoxyribonuclease RuvC
MSPMAGELKVIVMGIDPGLARTGYGVIEQKNGAARHLGHGCIVTSGDGKSPGERLLEVYAEMNRLLSKFLPDELAIEQLFFSKNVTSAMHVSEVKGVILLAATQHRIPVTEYTPNQVKQAVTGSGKADKRQMQEMIARLLRLDALPKPDDAADGLCIALCHANVARY